MKALFVIAPENYQDLELGEPKKVLEAAGVECKVASTRPGQASGALGGSTAVDLTVGEANADEFDAVVFVGGGGVEQHKLYEDPAVLGLAKAFAEKGKIVAAICISPRTLAKAGLLKGKKATFYPDGETRRMLEEAGAVLSEAGVVVDGKTVTANGPPSAKAFGEKILSLLRP